MSGNAYVQVPSLQITDLKLPADVKGLYELSYNLGWTWNPEARLFFGSIDRASWASYRNPVELLLNVDPHQWETLIQDDAFMANLARARARPRGVPRPADRDLVQQELPRLLRRSDRLLLHGVRASSVACRSTPAVSAS